MNTVTQRYDLYPALFGGLTTFLLVVFTVFSADAMDPRFELTPKSVQGGGVPLKPEKRPEAKPKPKHKVQHKRLKKAMPGGEQGPSLHLQHAGFAPAVPAAALPAGLRPTWDRLITQPAGPSRQLSFQSESFSLTIDPARYPLLPAQDGGTILLDSQATLPPLVRTLIQERDRSIRVISTPATDSRRFLGDLLGAAGFYSVEEQFLMEYGTDPRLTVRADFKVERTADSLVRQELVLINAGTMGSSPRVADFLRSEGITLMEPFASELPSSAVARHQLYRFASRGQGETVDALLGALAIPFQRNQRVELFSAAESGIGLSVQADRFFERGGKRYIVTRFSGDPVAYTLLRLLETKGYRVVILEAKDNFRAVAEKLLARLDQAVSYAPHLLVSHPSGRYSLEISAFLLENAAPGGGAVVLTDKPLDRVVRDLLVDHGYQVQER